MISKIVCKRGKTIEISDVHWVASPVDFNIIGFTRFENNRYIINNFNEQDLLILNRNINNDSGMRFTLKYK